jgi:hypothetical protein
MYCVVNQLHNLLELSSDVKCFIKKGDSMNNLLKNWPPLRITYLVVSLVLIGLAFMYGHDIFLYILGIGFLVQTLLNVGCSNGECQKPTYFNYRRRH